MLKLWIAQTENQSKLYVNKQFKSLVM